MNLRSDEGEVNRVEMSIELQRPARLSAGEPYGNGRRRRVPRRGPLDSKPFADEHFAQSIEDCPSLAGLARYLDQLEHSSHEALAIDQQTETLGQVRGKWHDQFFYSRLNLES
jgi:hypothetical protein